MSDRLEGRAILFPLDGIEYLQVVAVRANGDRKPHRMSIPVRPKGTPPGKSLTWEYTILRPNRIQVSPSVKVTTNTGPGTPEIEIFHNEGIWDVEYEHFTPLPEMVWEDGVGDHGQRRRFKELNPGDITM